MVITRMTASAPKDLLSVHQCAVREPDLGLAVFRGKVILDVELGGHGRPAAHVVGVHVRVDDMGDVHVQGIYQVQVHNIRVHVFTCVLALQIAHLMRRQADRAGIHLSVRELLTALAGIEETVLIYPSTGGRPKARRMLTETDAQQNDLIEIFNLRPLAPRT